MKNNLKKRRARPITDEGEIIAYMRPLTLGELRRVQADVAALPENDEKNLTAAKHMLAAVLCDEKAALLMSGPDDPAFEEIELPLLNFLFEKVTELQAGKR